MPIMKIFSTLSNPSISYSSLSLVLDARRIPPFVCIRMIPTIAANPILRNNPPTLPAQIQAIRQDFQQSIVSIEKDIPRLGADAKHDGCRKFQDYFHTRF